MRCLILAFLLIFAPLAHGQQVSEQITDSITQADTDWGHGNHTPSGRTWHRDNYVLNHGFRQGDSTPAEVPAPAVYAMPTPVNGQITDEATEVNPMITD